MEMSSTGAVGTCTHALEATKNVDDFYLRKRDTWLVVKNKSDCFCTCFWASELYKKVTSFKIMITKVVHFITNHMRKQGVEVKDTVHLNIQNIISVIRLTSLQRKVNY